MDQSAFAKDSLKITYSIVFNANAQMKGTNFSRHIFKAMAAKSSKFNSRVEYQTREEAEFDTQGKLSHGSEAGVEEAIPTAIVRGRKAPFERWVFENIKVIGKSNSIINYTCLLLANTYWKLRHLEKARWYKTLILYLYYKRDVPKSKLLLAAAVHSPEQWAELNFPKVIN